MLLDKTADVMIAPSGMAAARAGAVSAGMAAAQVHALAAIAETLIELAEPRDPVSNHEAARRWEAAHGHDLHGVADWLRHLRP
jgi:uncharacterized protein YmfQ (DUF2313 family)